MHSWPAFDFYFGNTGLVDVFNPKAADWFWQRYHELLTQGVFQGAIRVKEVALTGETGLLVDVGDEGGDDG